MSAKLHMPTEKTPTVPTKHWLKKGELWLTVVLAFIFWLVPMSWIVRAVGFSLLLVAVWHLINRTDVSDDLRPNTRWILTSVMAVVILVGGGSLIKKEYEAEHAQKPADASLKITTGNNPSIESSYNVELLGLPISLPPHSITPIIHIRHDRTVDITDEQNSDDKSFL